MGQCPKQQSYASYQNQIDADPQSLRGKRRPARQGFQEQGRKWRVGHKAHERLILPSNSEAVLLPLKPYPLVGAVAASSFSKQMGCDVVVREIGIEMLPS